MSVRQTSCRHCGQDIEGVHPYRRGQWRDRGNNTHCPTPAGDAGQTHVPQIERRRRAAPLAPPPAAAVRTSTQLRRLELGARQLLARAGRVAEDYDSARLTAALGHLSMAAEELHQAAIVRATTERHA